MSLKAAVRDKYAEAAKQVAGGGTACCGGSSDGSLDGSDPITGNLYDASQTSALPAEAVKASLGCGNPTALAQLRAGEIVLDLGSGGGIDVLLSAKRVGPAGFAYGLDMTDETLSLAEKNKAAASAKNRSGPPNSATTAAIPYHSQPSPQRVAAIIHNRSQRGARQRFTRRISR